MTKISTSDKADQIVETMPKTALAPEAGVESIGSKACRKCGTVLNEETWSPYYRKMNNRICRKCIAEASRDAYWEEPEARRKKYREQYADHIGVEEKAEREETFKKKIEAEEVAFQKHIKTIKSIDLEWAAGVWEARAGADRRHTVYKAEDGTEHVYDKPRLRLSSINKELLEKFKSIMGVGSISFAKKTALGKDSFSYCVIGDDAVRVARAIWKHIDSKKARRSIAKMVGEEWPLVCRECGEALTEANQYQSWRKRNGRLCKTCHKKRSTKWRTDNRERVNELTRIRRNETLQESRMYARLWRLNKDLKIEFTENDYRLLLQKQDYQCKICKRALNEESAYIDHDHKLGIVRGLLCEQCNAGIGHFKDSIQLLLAALGYLQKPFPDLKSLTTTGDFPTQSSHQANYHGRASQVNYHRRARYDIEEDEFLALKAYQDNRCAICLIEFGARKNHIHIDHDHKANQIRGILCNSCNTGLGLLGDTLEAITNAIAYLDHSIKN